MTFYRELSPFIKVGLENNAGRHRINNFLPFVPAHIRFE